MPTKYIKTGESPEGKERRLRAFRHNSYKGFVSRTKVNMNTIASSDSTNKKAKELAYRIVNLSDKLMEALNERVD